MRTFSFVFTVSRYALHAPSDAGVDTDGERRRRGSTDAAGGGGGVVFVVVVVVVAGPGVAVDSAQVPQRPRRVGRPAVVDVVRGRRRRRCHVAAQLWSLLSLALSLSLSFRRFSYKGSNLTKT